MVLEGLDDVAILIFDPLQALIGVIEIVSDLVIHVAGGRLPNQRAIGIRCHLRSSRIEPEFVDIAATADGQ